MTKIQVLLNAVHGYSCIGSGNISNATIEVEITDTQLATLLRIGDTLTAQSIVESISNGSTELEPLHEQLSEEFYYMVEEYWLHDADNEFLYDNLGQAIIEDVSNGLYTPTMLNDENEDENEDDDEDEDEDEDDADNWDLDDYYDWVRTHDHPFIAERVGLDLEACRDQEVDYVIILQ